MRTRRQQDENSENVTNLKYVGETLTNQNASHKKIRNNRIPGILASNTLGMFCLPFGILFKYEAQTALFKDPVRTAQ